MAYRLPDLTDDPRGSYEALLLENRAKGRAVPEVGAFAAEIALSPSGGTSSFAMREPSAQALWLSYEATLNEVEADGRSRARRGEELSYHNRAHVADCLLALACLYRFDSHLDDHAKLLGLVVMAGHDLGHQGRTNEELGSAGEQERQTLARLVEGAWRGLRPADLSAASQLLLGTDPAAVKENHRRFLAMEQPSELDLLQVLINEADIAGSFHPSLAESLTLALLRERGQVECKVSAASMYEIFRSQAMVSSTPGRLLLGHAQ
ncbi:MAG: hypothetical protein RLY67_962 [Pseudomonadota bacterium]